ncbi:MAG: membrane protein insertion efficiency factor YidD [Thermodesulfobacteriota bacterium]|nr:membrane protein insertion efficiency factor YidD [Thermodesulfobacteriota bacterium]
MREKAVHQVLKRALFTLLHIYQHTLSLLLGPCCRFFPSCSSYALESIERFGTLGGIKLTLKRLIKCHPFSPGGYDPVPETTKNL